MADTLAIPASPRRVGTGRTGGRAVDSSQKDGALLSESRERLRPAPTLPVSESRRARNRERIGLVSEIHCECGQPNCKDMLPAVAETHRGIAERFVVTPAHFEDGVVVRAADRFFVIQPPRVRIHEVTERRAVSRSPTPASEARPAASAGMDSGAHFDLKRTAGFLVTDARSRVVGRVEGPMYGCSGETPDALSVRFSLLRWRRRLVPASAIAAIDERTKVIGLGINRDAIDALL